VVQVVGALACGPKTVYVIAFVAALLALERVALRFPAVMVVPAVPVEGAPTVVVGLFTEPARRSSKAIDPQGVLVMVKDSF
jgi:hypothetical protein